MMTGIYRGLLFAAIVAIPACTFDGSNGGAGPDTGLGSPVDSGVLDPDGSTTNPDGSTVAQDSSLPCPFDNTAICASGPPIPDITISTNDVFNTDTDERCKSFTQNDTTPSCLVYTDQFTVQSGNTLRVIGSRVLLVASLSDVVIDGDIDVSSKRATGNTPESLGAGSPSSLCVPGASAEDDIGGAGGGGGGSYQHSGGAGGIGDTNQNAGGDGNAAGGVAATTNVPTTIRAGCPGSSGGVGQGPGGTAGASGGAIGFIAIGNFSQGSSSGILASGAGAIGGGPQSGGGGGGSGGMVYIEAAEAKLDGTIAAEGGGGGGGGVATGGNSATGDPGEDATLMQNGLGGDGGSFIIRDVGTFAGGDGGDGATIFIPQGSLGQNDSSGGGGGGGGAGYIVVVSDILETQGVYSPDITER